MMQKKARVAIATLVTAVGLATLAATPAMAEGNWDSYIYQAPVGFSSRNWTDNNTDSASTYDTNSGCSQLGGGYSSHLLNLYIQVPGWFDQSKGTRRSYCSTANWGHVSAGTYHWTVEDINGSAGSTNRLSVSDTHEYY